MFYIPYGQDTNAIIVRYQSSYSQYPNLCTPQMMMLLGLWFYRLYKTYKGVPSLSLQKRTIISFTLFILSPG